MLTVCINGKHVSFYLQDIDYENFMRINKYVIKQYGMKLFLKYLYWVRHPQELEEYEYKKAIKLLQKNI